METPPVVFTAVEGTLLDFATFESGPSRALIRRLHDAGVSVVPVSVMTLDELAPIATDLGLRPAMIIEAGGAIARWRDGEWAVEPCWPEAEMFLDVIAEIEDRSGANLLVYSATEQSLAARVPCRSFSEPFLIESGDVDAIRRAAAEIGFSVRRGRRFFHLCRAGDEAEAFERLREELHSEVAIGVGGSAIDAEFLSRVDVAIIVPGPDGTLDPELLARVPGAIVAPAAGSAGWAAAVDEVVASVTIPKKRARKVASSR